MASRTIPAGTLAQAVVFGDPHLHTDGDLLALTFAPDGSLWSVEEPGVLRHWNPATGAQLGWRSLSDLEMVWCFSQDARVLASASDELSFWDTSSGLVLTVVPQPSWITALSFHSDPAFLATGHDDGVVRYWDAAGHHLVREFRLHKRPISVVAFSPDGSRVAVAGEDKIVSLWSLVDGKHLASLTGHTDRIPALAWHPSGDYLVSAGWDATARIWDARSGEPIILLNTHAAQVTALAFSPDGALLASGDSECQVHLWDFASRKTRRLLKGPQAEIHCLAFSPDGKRIAASGDHLIHIWEPKTGQALAGSGARQVCPPTLAISPDGSRLATNGGGLTPCIWSIPKRKQLAELDESEAVHGLAFSPDGKWLAGAAEKHVRLWEAAKGKSAAALEGSEEPLTCVAISPDSKIVAGASGTGLSVWLWRIADGEPILLIPDALDGCTVTSLAFHPDGRRLAVGGIDWLATGGSDGAVCVWDIVERAEVATLSGGTTSIALHPSGTQLVAATLEQSLVLWDIDTQNILAEITGHEGPINCVAYAPDGSLIASGSDDRTVRLWNEEREEVGLLELDSQVKALAFSPDGRHLYTANGNTTCSQFELKRLLG